MSRRIAISITIGLCLSMCAGGLRAQFATIVDVPPSIVGNDQAIESDTQLNVLDGGQVGISLSVGSPDGSSANVELNVLGGTVGNRLEAFHGSTVNVTAGFIGPFFDANSGSIVNISGGFIADDFDAFAGSTVSINGGTVANGFGIGPGSVVTISGGAVGDRLVAAAGSSVTLAGGEFRLDGMLIDTVGTVDVSGGQLLSGTLADGSPFAFSSSDGDLFAPDSLRIELAEIRPIGNLILTASIDPLPPGIREGQSLVVDNGAVVDDHFAAGRGSQVTVEQGGAIGANLESVGAMVSVQGGSIGDRFDAFLGSTTTISGGTVGSDFDALRGSSVAVSGGSVGPRFTAWDGSEMRIAGGTIGEGFQTQLGSNVVLSGDEFRLNGAAMGPGPIEFPVDATLSGTFADGSPFAFSYSDGDRFAPGTLVLESAELPPVGPAQTVASAGNLPTGIRRGQTLVVDNGGIVGDDFSAGVDSIVNVNQGGKIGDNFEATGAEVTISGGQVGDRFDAFAGSHVILLNGSVGDEFDAERGSNISVAGGTIGNQFDANGAEVTITSGTVGHFSAVNAGSVVSITGGTVGQFFDANAGSIVNIAGGVVRERFEARPGSTVNISAGSVRDRPAALGGSSVHISGGTVGNRFEIVRDAVVTISGGAIGDRLVAADGSSVTISGGEFQLNGVELNQLGPLDIPRGATVSGTLADGTPFAFNSDDRDSLANGTLTLDEIDLPAIGPAQLVATIDSIPLGIRQGQSLVVDTGGSVGDHFGAGAGSDVRIEGGTIGENLEAVGATVAVIDGTIGDHMDAFNGSTIKVFGGHVGDDLGAFNGSEVEILGGVVGAEFHAYGGSTVTLRGGFVDDEIDVASGSTLTIFGGEFRLGPEPVETIGTIGGSVESTLSGTLSDGTPFAFSAGDEDALRAGTVTLVETNLPPIGPDQIVAALDEVPRGIRGGQTLIVDTGGTVEANFSAGWNSEVRIGDGGQVGANFEAVASRVQILGGTVGDDFDALSRTQVTISNGVVGDGFDVDSESNVQVEGGSVGDKFEVNNGSQVVVSGGAIGNQMTVRHSSATIQGGVVGHEFSAFAGSVVSISNGQVGNHFDALDESKVTIDGGRVGNDFDALRGSSVHISGGAVGERFDAFDGSQVVVSGGVVGADFDANRGSTVRISGGEIGTDFDAFGGSDVEITGGRVGRRFQAFGGSQVVIFGGEFGDEFQAESSSTVRLFGSEFALDGEPIAGLENFGDRLTLAERNGQTLSVVLRDETVNDFRLFSLRSLGDYFASDANLELVLVGEKLCDLNGDDFCTVDDVDTLVASLVAANHDRLYDLNFDGLVNQSDLDVWLRVAAEENGFSAPYLSGDANLDGHVDATDLNALAIHWTTDVALWSAGDFQPDGMIDSIDLNEIGVNWQQSVPQLTATVPEPKTSFVMGCFLVALTLGWRSKPTAAL